MGKIESGKSFVVVVAGVVPVGLADDEATALSWIVGQFSHSLAIGSNVRSITVKAVEGNPADIVGRVVKTLERKLSAL